MPLANRDFIHVPCKTDNIWAVFVSSQTQMGFLKRQEILLKIVVVVLWTEARRWGKLGSIREWSWQQRGECPGARAGNSAQSLRTLSYRHTLTHIHATYFMSLLFSCKLTSLDGNKQVGRRPCQLGNSTVSVVCSGRVCELRYNIIATLRRFLRPDPRAVQAGHTSVILQPYRTQHTVSDSHTTRNTQVFDLCSPEN